MDCLTEDGWSAKLNSSDGGIQIESKSQEKIDAAMDQCDKSTEQLAPKLDQNNANAYYAMLLNVSQCLDDIGFEPMDTPSRAESVKSMLSGPPIDPLWDPYDALFRDTQDFNAIESAMQECPKSEFGAISHS